MLQAIRTLLKKPLLPPLLHITLCWVMTGCTNGIMDDETREKIPYTNSYAPPNTPPETFLGTLFCARIQKYETLIEKCKKHLGLEKTVKNISFEEIYQAQRKFSIKHHPDKGRNEEIFKKGKNAWEALESELRKDELGREDLKEEEEGLLTYLERYLKTYLAAYLETAPQ